MKNLHKILYLFIALTIVSCSDPETKEDSGNKLDKPKKTEKKDDLQTVNEKLRKDPNNAALYYRRAQIYLNQNLSEDAFNDIERSLDLDSVNADYLLLKSELFFINGNGFEAKAIIQKSIDNNPKHVESYLKMAEIQLYTKQYKESISNVNNALKVDVYNAKAYF